MKEVKRHDIKVIKCGPSVTWWDGTFDDSNICRDFTWSTVTYHDRTTVIEEQNQKLREVHGW